MKVRVLFLSFFTIILVTGLFAGGRTDNASPEPGSAVPAARLAAHEYPYTDYRHHSQFPLSKTTPLRIAIARVTSDQADWDRTWAWNFLIERSGLRYEVEQIIAAAIPERKNLMFASGDLAEVLIGFSFTPTELVRYGQTEGQILALNDYIKPEIMPHLSQWFSDYPDSEPICKAPDNNIYSLPQFNYGLPGSSERFFWNKTWLDDLGREIPTTLDAFLDTLYAIKRARPDSYPLGGGARGGDPRSYILNAMGYLTGGGNDHGFGIALRNGQLVIPGGDPLYREFLLIMKRLYDNGIIHPSFFSMEATAVNAMISQDRNGAIPTIPYLQLAGREQYEQWVSGFPLTSQWNSRQQWLAASKIAIGGCVVTSAAREVETIMRWLDVFFGDFGRLLLWFGPPADSDYLMGLSKGYIINESGTNINVEVADGTFPSSTVRNYQQTIGTNAFGNYFGPVGRPDTPDTINIARMFYGLPPIQLTIDPNRSGDSHFRFSMLQNITPFETEVFPYFIYFDERTGIIMSDLASVINPFIETETARFITGIRNINEFDTYLRELRALGFDTYLDNYRRASGY